MTPHVWHQGRKVTPFAGTGRYRYGHYGYYGMWFSPQKQHEIWKAAAKRRNPGPGTVGEGTNRTTTVSLAFGQSFRLLNDHGKPYGRRYRCTGRVKEVLGGRWYAVKVYQVIDQHGVVGEIQGPARVRLVDQQPEDYHSYASRVLTRAHKAED